MTMKIKNIIAAVVLAVIPVMAFAQSDMTNEEHSKTLGYKIEVAKAEIKAIKAKLKLTPRDTDLLTEKALKEDSLAEMKMQKKTIDTAIKAEKKSVKASKAAEKASKKNDSASKAAEKLKSALLMTEQSNELVSDELDNKIEVMKAELKLKETQKKTDPDNITLKSQIATTKTQIKELKRQKKTIDTAIKAEKKSVKENKLAEKALEKHEKAHEEAEKLKEKL